MKTNKILYTVIIAFIFLISINSVAGVSILDNINSYYKSDTNGAFPDANGSYDGTINSATYTGSGKINGAYIYDGASGYVNFSKSGDISFQGAWTVNAWAYPESTHAVNPGGILGRNDATDGTVIEIYAGKFGVWLKGSSSGARYQTTHNINLSEWSMYTATRTGNTVKLYINGLLQNSHTVSHTPAEAFTNFGIGASLDGVSASQFFDGVLDEIGWWSRELNQTEINILLNSGTGIQYPFTNPPIITFVNVSLINNTVTNIDPVEINVSIQTQDTNNNTNISYSLDGASIVQFATNSLNGTINLNVSENFTSPKKISLPVRAESVSLDQFCLEETGINNSILSAPGFSTTVAEWNGTAWKASLVTRSPALWVVCGAPNSLLEGDHTIYFFAFNNETNTTSDTYNFVIDTLAPQLNVNNYSETNSYLINFTNIINISDNNLDSCVVSTDEAISTTCFNESYRFSTNGNHSFNVTANDSAGNTNYSNNNVIFVNPSQYFYFNDSDGNPISNFSLGGTVYTNFASIDLYDLGIGNHSLLFEKLGFASTSIDFSFNTTSNINTSNTINFSFIQIRIFDRDTNNLITDNVSIVLVGDVGFTGSTITGLLNISGTQYTAGDYQIIASTTNYETESVYFTYTNQETILLDIYMINNSASNLGVITITVKEDTLQFVPGAIVKALEWKPDISAYVSVAEGLTNVNGEVTLNIELNTKLYKFSASKANTTMISPSFIISSTPASLTLILTGIGLEVVPLLENLLFNMTNTTINSTHQTISFYWEDKDNTVSSACLDFYQVSGTSRTLLNQTCISGASGDIIRTFSINNTYNLEVESTVIIEDLTRTLKVIKYKSTADISFSFSQYGLDLLIPLFFVLLGLVLGLYMANIYISVVLMCIMSWVSYLIFPSVITSGIAMTLSIFAIIALWAGFKSK